MPVLTKFPRTKLLSILATLAGLAAIWGVLAWPDLAQSHDKTGAQTDPNVAALRALAALTPQQREWLSAAQAAAVAPAQPVPAAPPPAQRQVIVRPAYIYRTIPGPVIEGDPPPGSAAPAQPAPESPSLVVAAPPSAQSAPPTAPTAAAPPAPEPALPPAPAPPAPAAPAPAPPPPAPAPAPTAVSKPS